MPPKRKKRFTREQDLSPPSSPEVVRKKDRTFIPPQSPPRRLTRSKRNQNPTCLTFGPFREAIYSDFFFCSNCKLYEDALSSGLSKRIVRNSKRFRCTAGHVDFIFPSHRLELPKCVAKSTITSADDSDDSLNYVDEVDVMDGSQKTSLRSSCAAEEDFGLQDAFDTLAEAYAGIDSYCQSQISHLTSKCEEEAAVSASLRDEIEKLKATVLEQKELLNQQKQAMKDLHQRVHSLVTNLNYYRKKFSNVEMIGDQAQTLDDAIIASVDALLKSRQRFKLLSEKRKAEAIAKAVLSNEFAGGIAYDKIIGEVKKWLRKNVFTPEEILKQMDLHGGTLNYEGISILNEVEAASHNGRKLPYGSRLLCTPACLKRVAKKLEETGNELCPFSMSMTPCGESIEFDYGKATRLIVEAFGLQNIGRDSAINLSASIDAARLTKNICHTSAGVKMTDPRGFYRDGTRLQDMQSQNTIFLLKIVLTKETKESFKLFDDVFQFFRLTGLNQEEREADEKNEDKFSWEPLADLHPINVTCATDMAADWKISGVGGGCKSTEMFCSLCTCPSSEVHQPNAELCDRFCSDQVGNPNWRCYHHPIASPTCSSDLQEEINRLKARLLADLEIIEQRSRIKYDANPNAVSRTTNPRSIFFTPRNDDEKDDFIDLLINELLLRRLSVEGHLEDLRQRLLSELIIEDKYRKHVTRLVHCTALEACIIALLHKIPCILHAENRIGIKLLMMLLTEGFSNALERKIFIEIPSARERIKAYAQKIEDILNHEILGDDDGPAQWCVPMDDQQKSVGTITLDNNRIRLILEDFEVLIRVSVHDEVRLGKYLYCIPEYRAAMKIVRQREEFTDEDIKKYQRHVDCWFQTWNELHSDSGCTNYTHMFSSGHLSEYMFKWRNLYRFSQQGWEKFNHVFSTFYFRRTNHGGRRHRDTAKSKLLPIGRWLQRRLLWMTGEAQKILGMVNINNNTP